MEEPYRKDLFIPLCILWPIPACVFIMSIFFFQLYCMIRRIIMQGQCFLDLGYILLTFCPLGRNDILDKMIEEIFYFILFCFCQQRNRQHLCFSHSFKNQVTITFKIFNLILDSGECWREKSDT